MPEPHEEAVMKRTIAVGLALAMALLGQAAPGMAQTDSRRGDQNNRGDQNERWGDRTQGSENERWGDRTQASEIDLEGRWIAKRGYNQPPRARGGTGLQATLPPRLVIDQRRNVIRVEDFKGRVLQEIVVGGLGRGGANRGGGDAVVGQWRDSKLLTVRNGIHNTRIVQTFALSNRGRTLVVTTRQDGMGSRHDMEYTNVYQRA